ncbi:PEP-CTERM sorting domain-containing protein [Aquabacterium sp. A7-Y]|uniref:PEP-CTERM sorting domain-containing protein n=1 Tax=Aquabacterium sp. A7-Y TaxID=1349605 RepID=UPI00223E613A|nr:PEP-CTERM sorting domain-containing protein [Aquabacterium sp. A7-Y]MCW7540840.1 PEP-CTERM sorting domain-containing protein [Aquabacterium sp. A7-Y]
MKASSTGHTFKRLLLAAAAALSFPALAATPITGGDADLVFSQAAIDTLGLISVSVAGTGSATTVTPGQSFSFPVTGGSVEGNAVVDVLTDVNAGVSLTKGSTVINLGDFRVDVGSKTLYGDITIGAQVVQNTALYTFTTVTDVEAGPNARTVSASGMFITETALNTLGDALGVPTFLRPAVAGVDFGTLTGNLTVAAVPEPSTYAMLGLGLAGIGFYSKRRRAAAAASEAPAAPQAA